MKKLTFSAGTNLRTAAAAMIEAAAEHGQASTEFNGITLIADKSSTVDSIVADFDTQREAAAERYRNSPEGKKAAEELRERIARLQAVWNESVAELPGLDFNDQGALLTWFEKLQEPSDNIHVERTDCELIVQTFAEHGYLPNANVGPAFNERDADNVARYIIGQCLDGLQRCSIHQVVHHFIGEWRNKFQAAAA